MSLIIDLTEEIIQYVFDLTQDEIDEIQKDFSNITNYLKIVLPEIINNTFFLKKIIKLTDCVRTFLLRGSTSSNSI